MERELKMLMEKKKYHMIIAKAGRKRQHKDVTLIRMRNT